MAENNLSAETERLEQRAERWAIHPCRELLKVLFVPTYTTRAAIVVERLQEIREEQQPLGGLFVVGAIAYDVARTAFIGYMAFQIYQAVK